MAVIMDGKKLAEKITRRLAGQFKSVGKLAAVQIGENSASELYLKKKGGLAEQLGVKFELHKLPVKTSLKQITELICKLNNNKKIAGIIVQLPLPKQLDTDTVVNLVNPSKDVDGLTDANILSGNVLPATATGILKLFAEYKIETEGKQIALVGFTRLLNLPLSLYFVKHGNPVVVLQKGTKNFAELKRADIVITAAGQPGLISGKDIKAGAVMIDAGISTVKGRVVGDLEAASVAKKASFMTPVPGGVGPMTVVSLLINLKNLTKKGL